MKLICFYLPQFHPIPENDKWWGKGFTEWTNVAKSLPRFRGHHQPRIPADLGFYDLRLEETRIAQAKLAEKYGIGGFCYYHYWFNGKMVLERPLNEMLESNKPDFPFCMCWANENWSRAWDGKDSDVLLEQKYDRYDVNEHMSFLHKAFSDNRYIKINEKPLFLIYNPSHIPNLEKIISQLRQAAKKKGLPGIYLCSVMSHQNTLSPDDAISIGFDAVTEFHPNPKSQGKTITPNFIKYILPRLFNAVLVRTSLGKRIPQIPVPLVYSYKRLVKNAVGKYLNSKNVFPCVSPGWDNSARRRVNPVIIQNSDSQLFGLWLKHAIEKVKNNNEDERIVFINAWNEWAEGCYLEPDLKNGKKFLKEVSLQLKNGK